MLQYCPLSLTISEAKHTVYTKSSR